MELTSVKTHVLSRKIIPRTIKELAVTYGAPEDHRSIGFFSADNDDVAYLAADEATKKANVKILRVEAYYGGRRCAWSKYGGGVFVLMSGPKVQDVRSGISYACDYVEKKSELFNLDGDPGTFFYAGLMPKAGKYYQEHYHIPEEMAYAHLVGGPIEANYALDKALKAGDTQIAKYWYPPSNANSSGAILYGSESACRSARNAFIDAMKFSMANPMNI